MTGYRIEQGWVGLPVRVALSRPPITSRCRRRWRVSDAGRSWPIQPHW